MFWYFQSNFDILKEVFIPILGHYKRCFLYLYLLSTSLLAYMGVFDLAFVSTYLRICWIKPDNWHHGRKRGIWASILTGFHYGS